MNKYLTLEDSFVIKGVAILMMLVHHMFLSPDRWGKSIVNFFPLSQAVAVNIAVFFKVCVALFVFVTAYGLTVKLKNSENLGKALDKQYFINFVGARIFKLLINFWFIFALCLLYSFAMGIGHFTKIYGKGSVAYGKFFLDFMGGANLYGTPTFNGTWWYMSLAILLVICFPLIYMAYKKYGCILFFALLLLPVALHLPYSEFNRYMPCAAMGMIFADKEVFYNLKEKLDSSSLAKRLGALLMAIIVLFVLAYLASLFKKVCSFRLIPLFEACNASLVIGITYLFITNVYVRKILYFLGKHSMNIFFTHTLLRHYWYHDFIYGFKYAWLDVLVLLLISLGISFVINALKKVIKFEKLEKLSF